MLGSEGVRIRSSCEVTGRACCIIGPTGAFTVMGCGWSSPLKGPRVGFREELGIVEAGCSGKRTFFEPNVLGRTG
jgi:hypothetical protein